MNNKSRKPIAFFLTLVIVMFSSCNTAKNGSSHSDSSTESKNQTTVTVSSFSDFDMNAEVPDSAVKIVCNGASASIDGKGAKYSDGKLIISAKGSYILSGTLNGMIQIDASDSDKVQLQLCGLSVENTEGSAIIINSADKVSISLKEGTENTVSDGSAYFIDSEASEKNTPNAAIYAKCDVTLNGKGKLTVNGNCYNAISTCDNLKICDCTISATAKNNGLRGKDSVSIASGTVTIKCENDGIKATASDDSSKGFVSISGGEITVSSGGDGISGETGVVISDNAKLTVSSGGGSSANTTFHGDNMFRNNQSNSTADEVSTKGIKSSTSVVITGGEITIDSNDDAIHSNGNVSVSGGTLSLMSGDDGIHTDMNLNITDGDINISKSYEGLEGKVITISGGKISVTSSDDGLNATDGTSSSQGGGTFAAQDGVSLNISGGFLYVNASGDGLDSNNALYISGGTVLIDGPTNSGNGALDSNGVLSVTGGTLVASGSVGMAETPDSSSTQNSFSITTSLEAGQIICVTDSSDKTVIIYAPSKACQSVIISSPNITEGDYNIYTGGSSTGKCVNGLYTGGEYSGGTKLTSLSVSTYLTTYGSQSNTMGPGGGGFGGGGFGGGRPDKTKPDGFGDKSKPNRPE